MIHLHTVLPVAHSNLWQCGMWFMTKKAFSSRPKDKLLVDMYVYTVCVRSQTLPLIFRWFSCCFAGMWVCHIICRIYRHSNRFHSTISSQIFRVLFIFSCGKIRVRIICFVRACLPGDESRKKNRWSISTTVSFQKCF